MITRFSVIPDKRRLLLGVDKANIFEAGIIYEATKVLDEIILKPIGKYALPEKGIGSANSTIEEICLHGTHLITKPEAKNLNINYWERKST